jgi:hypothetical protein
MVLDMVYAFLIAHALITVAPIVIGLVAVLAVIVSLWALLGLIWCWEHRWMLIGGGSAIMLALAGLLYLNNNAQAAVNILIGVILVAFLVVSVQIGNASERARVRYAAASSAATVGLSDKIHRIL